jgi:predicted chitinase
MNNNFFVGVVEDRVSDPLKLGRVKVRVFGVHSESIIDVPTEALPWAIPIMSSSSASLSGIGDAVPQYVEGTTVFLFFQDGDSKQQPIILGSLAGIPLSKDPFATKPTAEVGAAIVPPKSTVLESTSGSLVDSSGQVVTDSTGNPILVESDEIPPLDISAMVAKFGSNVTTVYKALLNFGIKDPYGLIGILSNVAKETKFKLVRENLKYTTTTRLKQIFPKYFSTMADSEVEKYVNNEEALANLVYASRYGNGDTASGDGYKYRGGGFIQLTFKSNYSAVGSKIGSDIVSNPDNINNPDIASKAVAQFFINAYGGAKRISFSSIEEGLTSVTKKVNSGGFTNDYPKVVEYSKLCKIIEDKTAEQDKTAEITKPNAPENDVDKTASKAKIDSGTASKNRNTTATGFKDPSGKYPLNQMLNEQDTSRLARRNTNNTSIELRNNKRMTAIKSVAGTTFDEPAPSYNAQYPYNKVHTTESGHTIEFDDTPGNERISQFHSAGTYTEIDKYGNTVNKIVGDSFQITERNGYIYIDGTARISVGSDVKLYVAGNMDIEVDGNLNYNVGGSVNWKIGGDSIQGIAGVNSVRSGGSTDVDSSTINLNSGTSQTNTPSTRSGTSNDYIRRIPENYLGGELIKYDDADEATVDAAHAEQVASGEITQQEIDEGKAAKADVKDETPPPEKPTLTPSCGMFANKDMIPDTTQISKYYTIGMLSSKAVVSHDKLKPQHNLEVPEIACNLKNLAENCLDLIKTKYSNMMVTSGFRHGTTTSQHQRGMAADMQFTGATKGDYYDIASWIKSNVPFDQLLLEYKVFGTGQPWIHISFNSTGNRGQVMTFMNNKPHGNGLQKLQS